MGRKNPLQFLEKIASKTLNRGSSESEYITFEFTSFGAVLAHLDVSSARPKIKRFAYLEIAPDMTESEKKNAYLSFLSVQGVKKIPKGMVSHWDGMTFRQLNLPPMPYEDLMKAVVWELKKKYFYNPDENHLGYLDVMEVEGAEGPERLYNIFYCEKKATQARLDFLQSLGIEIELLVPGQTALAAFVSQVEPSPAEDVVICEIFDNNARILAVRENRNMLVRSVNVGQPGAGLTDDVLRKIADEVRITVDFYESQKHARPISKVVFAGGGYDVGRLHEYMTQNLQMKVVLPKLDDHVADTLSKEDREFILTHPGLFASSLGLPLVTEETVNLVPEDIKSVNRAKHVGRWLNLGLVGLALILSAVVGIAMLNINITRSRLVVLQKEYDEINSRREVFKATLGKSRVRRTARKGMVPLESLLKELSFKTPALASLKELQYNRQDGTLTLTGEVNDTKRESAKTVTQFATTLSESVFIESAAISSTSQDDVNNVIRFVIDCTVKGFS